MGDYAGFQSDKPDPTEDNGLDAINHVRQNLIALRDAAIAGAMPGWQESTSGGSGARPAMVIWSRDDERLRITYTWDDGSPVEAQYDYSNDAGTTWIDIGTETITWSANGTRPTIDWSDPD